MNDKTQHRHGVAIAFLILISLALLAITGAWFVRWQTTEMFRLSARWSGEQIHVYSAKDGPWYVTHLVAYQSNGYWRAVAQLPTPVTIIDSRGHYFTPEQIGKLQWIDLCGETQAPPVVGENIGVMYSEPAEGKRPPRRR